jgi:hypothetical protein
MKLKGSIVGAVSILLICTVVLDRRNKIEFKSLRESKSRLEAIGFHCIPDRSDGSWAAGFIVGRSPGSWEQVNTMCKSRPLGPDWKGKAWVSVNSPLWRSEHMPEKAGEFGAT